LAKQQADERARQEAERIKAQQQQQQQQQAQLQQQQQQQQLQQQQAQLQQQQQQQPAPPQTQPTLQQRSQSPVVQQRSQSPVVQQRSQSPVAPNAPLQRSLSPRRLPTPGAPSGGGGGGAAPPKQLPAQPTQQWRRPGRSPASRMRRAHTTKLSTQVHYTQQHYHSFVSHCLHLSSLSCLIVCYHSQNKPPPTPSSPKALPQRPRANTPGNLQRVLSQPQLKSGSPQLTKAHTFVPKLVNVAVAHTCVQVRATLEFIRSNDGSFHTLSFWFV